MVRASPSAAVFTNNIRQNCEAIDVESNVVLFSSRQVCCKDKAMGLRRLISADIAWQGRQTFMEIGLDEHTLSFTCQRRTNADSLCFSQCDGLLAIDLSL
jgi:hypothetical protein